MLRSSQQEMCDSIDFNVYVRGAGMKALISLGILLRVSSPFYACRIERSATLRDDNLERMNNTVRGLPLDSSEQREYRTHL